MTKWMVIQITEECPELTDNENSLCLPLADVEPASGDELLNLIETEAYEQGKQVQQFLFSHPTTSGGLMRSSAASEVTTRP